MEEEGEAWNETRFRSSVDFAISCGRMIMYRTKYSKLQRPRSVAQVLRGCQDGAFCLTGVDKVWKRAEEGEEEGG
jgi:hypothetical protein